MRRRKAKPKARGVNFQPLGAECGGGAGGVAVAQGRPRRDQNAVPPCPGLGRDLMLPPVVGQNAPHLAAHRRPVLGDDHDVGRELKQGEQDVRRPAIAPAVQDVPRQQRQHHPSVCASRRLARTQPARLLSRCLGFGTMHAVLLARRARAPSASPRSSAGSRDMSQAAYGSETTQGFAPPTVTQFSVFPREQGRQAAFDLVDAFDHSPCQICALSVHEARPITPSCESITNRASVARSELLKQRLPFSARCDVLVVELFQGATLLQPTVPFAAQGRASNIHFAYPLMLQPQRHAHHRPGCG
jgi:hypothetical protein